VTWNLKNWPMAAPLPSSARLPTSCVRPPRSSTHWIGLSPEDHVARLAELRQWAETVLRPEYGGYQLPACWASHPHAIWELSTLAAEWHRTYNRKHPDLNRALEFHCRWLPGTMRRITD
jgi:hypothetical protein